MNHPETLAADIFDRDGYTVVRGMVPHPSITAMREEVLSALDPLLGPAEFEADTGYPGAPRDRSAPGGATPRRLLSATARFPEVARWARSRAVHAQLSDLLGTPQVRLSQCHHNCVMTKHPGYSSATLWHQDIRYWSFDQPSLVSAWFRLGGRPPCRADQFQHSTSQSQL